MAAQQKPYIGDFIQRPSPNYGYGGQHPRWRAVTVHISEGTLESTLNWLCTPASNASAHIVIARDGELYQLVSFDAAAWCQGIVCDPDWSNPIIADTVEGHLNPNLVSYSVECVGFSRHGQSGALTAPQSDALARVVAYLCMRSALTVDRTHVLGHYQWDNCQRHNCPGFSPDEWRHMIARAANMALLWRGW